MPHGIRVSTSAVQAGCLITVSAILSATQALVVVKTRQEFTLFMLNQTIQASQTHTPDMMHIASKV